MGIHPFEHAASLKCALFPRARRTLTISGAGRHIKEHTERCSAPGRVRSSRRGTTVPSHNWRYTVGLHLSTSELRPACDQGRENAGAHRVLAGSYAVRGLVCNVPPFGLWVLNVAPSGLSSDAVQRFDYPECPACRRCPRRSDSRFCGSRCEEWALQQQQRQQLQLQQLQSQELQQRQLLGYQQRYPQRQHWQPLAVPNNTPNSGAIAWSNATRSANNGVWDTNWQGRYQP